MLTATSSGAIVAIFLRPNAGNAMGSILPFYLTATAWIAAKVPGLRAYRRSAQPALPVEGDREQARAGEPG